MRNFVYEVLKMTYGCVKLLLVYNNKHQSFRELCLNTLNEGYDIFDTNIHLNICLEYL